ncbi:MAG TPA: tachylectin-related carbohydrate-binding protein [Anditalea sp.]|nr:tachylectin-related carbohydrate-binding protein [Anditalea sp.]
MAEKPIITNLVTNAPGMVTISWAHSGQNNVLWFRIERKDPFGAATNNNHVGSYSDSGLTPSTDYSYRVCAVYRNGSEECTEWKQVRTMDPEPVRPQVDRTPPTITAHEVTPNSIKIKWSGQYHERFHIRWKKSSSPVDLPQIDIDHKGREGYREFTNLDPDTSYSFKIQGVRINVFGTAIMKSHWSDPPVQISTLPSVIPPPIQITPIYSVNNNGDLLWYRHEVLHDGSFHWPSKEGKKVGSGWKDFSKIFGGNDGVIYAVKVSSINMITGRPTGGDLLWYRHTGWINGTFFWASPDAKKLTIRMNSAFISQKWNSFPFLFSGGNGTLYTVANNGDLFWYLHKGWRDGTSSWDSQEGRKVGSGWNNFSKIFSGGNGVIYAIQKSTVDMRTGRRTGGNLLWYRHDGRNTGTWDWASNSGNKVGNNWSRFVNVFSGGNGIIYAIDENGNLLCYRHLGWFEGTFSWSPNSGEKIGHGWKFQHVFTGG